jgi:hypothetical protein
MVTLSSTSPCKPELFQGVVQSDDLDNCDQNHEQIEDHFALPTVM